MPETDLSLFTSESVTEGHPDKMADQISDAVLDEILSDDPFGRVACETLITTGLVVVAGEITTSTYVDIPAVVRRTVTDIGYTISKIGFDGETCGVAVAIQEHDGYAGPPYGTSQGACEPGTNASASGSATAATVRPASKSFWNLANE